VDLCATPAGERALAGPEGAGPFDKDRAVAMRFVAAACVLRSAVFGIDALSRHDAKGIAGNIVPAIATTNAIVAGVQMLEVFKILGALASDKTDEEQGKEMGQGCRYTYCLRDRTRRGNYLQPTSLPAPDPKCFVCRGARVELAIDTSTWTLDEFIHKVLKKRLGFNAPTIMVGDDIVHEEGEGADTDAYGINGPKKLLALPCGGIKDGTAVRIEDFTQDLEVDMLVCHREDWDEEEEPDGFLLGGAKSVQATQEKGGSGSNQEDEEEDDDDDDIIVVDDRGAETTEGHKEGEEKQATKRDTPEEEGARQGDGISAPKRARTEVEDDDDVVVVDDEASAPKKARTKEADDGDEDVVAMVDGQ